MSKSLLGIFALFLLSLFAVSCGGGGGGDDDGSGGSSTVAVTSVSVSPTSMTLSIGETSQLTATVKPDNATNKTVGYTSSNTSVATVSTSGLVTAVSEGTATITVTSGGKSATCSVTVVREAESITLSATTINDFYLGDTVRLAAEVLPQYSSPWSVTWTSSDSNIATVSADGLVTAVAIGTATITASAGGLSATCQVTVKGAESITLSSSTIQFNIGNTSQLTADVQPAKTTPWNVTWTSSAPSVATVSSDGLVTAIAIGTATVTASAGGLSATCEVSVVEVEPVVDVTGETATIDLNGAEGDQVVAALYNAASSGATKLVISGDYSSLGLRGTSYMKALNVTSLDLSGVTGWPSDDDGYAELPEGSFFENPILEEITLPSTVTSIARYAFYKCTSLKKVVAPGLRMVREYAFQWDSSLAEVDMPDLEYIEICAFYETALTSVAFQKLTTVEGMAFFQCANLKTVDLPLCTMVGTEYFFGNESKKTQTCSFYGCKQLTTVNLPLVENLGFYAFAYCFSLSSINIPNVVTISGGALYNCNSIVELNLPKATTLGAHAFFGCKGLRTLKLTTAEDITCENSSTFGASDTVTGNVDLTLNSNKQSEIVTNEFTGRKKWRDNYFKSYSFE